MSLDPATLGVVACILSAVIGALLLFSWMNDRRNQALGWWALCCLAAAAASLMYLSGGLDSDSLGRQLGNATSAFAFGLSYAAARRFNGKSMPWSVVALGPLGWLALILAFDADFFIRLIVMSLLVGGYGLATAYELWVEAGTGMPSQRAAAVVTAINATYFLLRPLGGLGMQASAQGAPIEAAANWLAVVSVTTILYAMIFGFLVMSMAKEKADLVYRRAALIDPLTGIANRRHFLDEAGRLIEDARRGQRSAALIMFDLDHFKAVNDGHGHMVGDQTLIEFCNIVASRLPPRAAFGRLGGEEFAVLVDGFTHRDAVEMAEVIRCDLVGVGAVIMGRPVAATVSAGVAAASGATLPELLAGADAALYRAKAEGRNRVVAASPAPAGDQRGTLAVA